MRLLLLLFSLFICTGLFSQDTTDASRLRMMSYMKYSDQVKCDSQAGSTLEMRVCLNLEFQKADSILNATFVLKLIPLSDSLQTVLKQEQASWVLERRNTSKEESRGFSGNMLGIMYLQSMIEITRKRIEALKES
ncbi:MAG TPA: DUF1311 domain-containing protein [Bacteroidetes bacterium]|nr:DUF1311 domain-containing protein [Bacteroidota bacterium]